MSAATGVEDTAAACPNGVGYRLSGSVAVIEVGRPSAHNALDLAMRHALLAAVRRWGLVHRVTEDGRAAAEGLALAERLAEGPTAAYREVKALLREAGTTEPAALLDLEAAAQERLGITQDHRQAVKAFLDRLPPVFLGR
ncbi:enoyl-CoA hydratase-related protein [Kitasatospora sp. NPDC015120]|uniref:enoyl-CoA hydratase-related protein n=1 Tax=Kitasatospora sp. NPDC015120 TaxID=3364023 RepID=UPI0036F497AE